MVVQKLTIVLCWTNNYSIELSTSFSIGGIVVSLFGDRGRLMGLLYIASGSLDEQAVRQLRDVYDELASAEQDITIDMSAVDRIDGSGLGAIVYLFKRLRLGGHKLRLIKVQGEALSLLTRLKVADVLVDNAGLESVPQTQFDPRRVLELLAARKSAFDKSASDFKSGRADEDLVPVQTTAQRA